MSAYVESIVEMTRSALDSLMRAAEATPEDKLTWQPLDVGRSALDQLAECLQVAGWFERVLAERSGDFFTREFVVSERRKREQITWAQVQEEIVPAYEKLYQAMRSLGEADLESEVVLSAGWNPRLREVCYFPLRNLWYHFGQVNYIQTLYGDKAMH